VGKPAGKGPHGRPRCKWEDNIKMGLQDLVNKTNLVHNFPCMFISILYIFQATMCLPSSGGITVSMRHLVFVTLCG
jgi:hypothetical protein